MHRIALDRHKIGVAGENCVIVQSLVLESIRACDGPTDGQTDGRTEAKHAACSYVAL